MPCRTCYAVGGDDMGYGRRDGAIGVPPGERHGRRGSRPIGERLRMTLLQVGVAQVNAQRNYPQQNHCEQGQHDERLTVLSRRPPADCAVSSVIDGRMVLDPCHRPVCPWGLHFGRSMK